MTTTMILAASAAAILVYLSYRWLLRHPGIVATLPAMAGALLGVMVFTGFLSMVRPVAQSETFVALFLASGAGTWTWWKLRVAIRPWLLTHGVS